MFGWILDHYRAKSKENRWGLPIANLHEVVSGKISRSAAVEASAVPAFRSAFGIKTYLDLRSMHDTDSDSRGQNISDTARAFSELLQALRLNKITHERVPMSDREPTPERIITEALSFLTDETRYPIHVACVGGVHRSGLIIAMYRTRIQGWTGAAALAEAYECNYYPERHREFDKEFRRLLGV